MGFVQDGDLAMHSNGLNTNASQFIVTLCPMTRLQGQHVCFGTVIKGMKVIREIADQATKLGRLVAPVRVINCGIYDEDNVPALPYVATVQPGLNEEEWRAEEMSRGSVGLASNL